MKNNRIDGCVRSGDLGVGEDVVVLTKMGTEVFSGTVIASTPFGVSIKNESESKFFQEEFYVFSVDEPEESKPVVRSLDDMTPDERVAYKRAKLSEADDADKKDDTEEKPKAKPVDKTDDKKQKDDGKEIGKDTDIETDKLPDDIKNAIINIDEIDGERLIGVLGDIGDASIKALKRAGISEDGLYEIVDKIQAAVKKVIMSSQEE